MKKLLVSIVALLAVVAVAVSSKAFAASPEVTDVISPTGLTGLQRTWAASTVDYNNDGLEDIWIGYHQQVDSKLMRNNGDGTFTYVAPDFTKRKNAQGGVFDRHDCQWADVDHNGLMDAYCSGGRNLSNYYKTAEKDNEMWMQYTPGNFTDVGTEWGIGDACGRGRFVAFADFNNDGWADLFVGNEKPRSVTDTACDPLANTYQHEYSKVFINTGGTGFRFAPEFQTPQPSAGVNCAIPVDYNHDGWTDLVACNYKTSRPALYRNNAGKSFTEVGSQTGIKLTAMTDGEYTDITGDGIKDLLGSDKNGIFYRPGTATGFGTAVRLYTNNLASNSNLFGWGVATGDVNGDGQLDIYCLIHDLSLNTNPDDTVLIGTGYSAPGKPSYRAYTVPSATGNASTVTALHVTPGEPIQFFVQNGLEDKDGPNQLIKFTTLSLQ